MLTYPHFGPEKNQAHKKQVDGNGDGGMRYYFGPGFFHFGTPVDVVKNKNGIVALFSQQLLKVSHGGCVAVVAVNVRQVYGLELRK